MKLSIINNSAFHDYDICDSIRLPEEVFKQLGIDDDGSIQACWMNCYSFRMPDFNLSISDFVRELRYRDILDESEVITDVYLEDEIDVSLKVGD